MNLCWQEHEFEKLGRFFSSAGYLRKPDQTGAASLKICVSKKVYRQQSDIPFVFIHPCLVITTLIDVEQHAKTNEAYIQHFHSFIITVHTYKKY